MAAGGEEQLEIMKIKLYNWWTVIDKRNATSLFDLLIYHPELSIVIAAMGVLVFSDMTQYWVIINLQQ